MPLKIAYSILKNAFYYIWLQQINMLSWIESLLQLNRYGEWGWEWLSHTASAGGPSIRTQLSQLMCWWAFCVYSLCLVGYLFQGMILPLIHSIPLLKKAERIGMSHEMTHWNLSLPTVSWVILGILGDGYGPWILHLKHGDGVYYVVAKKLFSFL